MALKELLPVEPGAELTSMAAGGGGDGGGAVSTRDGSLVLANEVGHQVALWDVARGQRRWQVPRKDPLLGGTAISGDGALAAWTDDFSLIVASAESGAISAVAPFDYSQSSIEFSHDGKRIAAASPRGVSVWRASDAALLWSIDRPAVKVSAARIRWSIDDSKLILGDDESSIVDSALGDLLAHLDPEARSPQPRSFVSPDLRYVVKKGRTAWYLQPLPPPEDGRPARLLASVLEQAGLELRGAELVLADQLRNASASRP